ncbi:hypothetical protein RSOLAG1IB_11971 [Rhizoctonia solani AG-1 IB]|uniref:CHAT domain-containing protein n=1 Tax=Thanatephorus cucumeris (strain AG1-IB / isolate 7/3/14) TaxID=1108050 RepID=A0A0B7FG79_THACB|nr:hypothetical protein RSOLAG1IB_11971 [Rhizoctonia solani AG-1 IB]
MTWCPTGLATFLPLHAAGDYDHPGLRASDYVVSSYTPMLSPLLDSTPLPLNPDSRMLLINQHETPGFPKLPGTVKEIEHIVGHIKNKVQHSLLLGEQATVAAVLKEMQEHDSVHFACHASQEIVEPTKTGIHLHDGTLDLATLNQQPYKSRSLAFLSACQTAQGDPRLPDEAIHLGAALLMTGYPTVIATMWSVGDGDAPHVAERFYGHLIEDRGTENGNAGRALHQAVAALRDSFRDNKFSQWVQYIHIGS